MIEKNKENQHVVRSIVAQPLVEKVRNVVFNGPTKRHPMKLIQFDFAYSGPFAEEMSAAMDGLARSIAQEPGFIWKIWTENQTTQEGGGISLFTDEKSARAYIAKHSARLKGFGIDNINAKIFDVNIPLSQITKAPIQGSP
jgi:hypothetical protein